MYAALTRVEADASQVTVDHVITVALDGTAAFR
ncbi:hypothetical protein FrEUN1fDRAFT_1726 [Parafrankia sp. EUN1f]|nr:hypothetical protein FrEUN1fDRAFT_1726 [Parafrankia sp. EUN1f]